MKLVKSEEAVEKHQEVIRLAIEAGIFTDAQLESALYELQKTEKPLSEILKQLYGLDYEKVLHLLAEDAGIEEVDISRISIEREALKKVPHEFAKRHKLIPILFSQNRLTVAMANPFDFATLDELQLLTRLYIDTRYAPESKIADAVERYYRPAVHRDAQPEKKQETKSYGELQAGGESAGPQVIRLVDGLMSHAIRDEATDIHIEPEENCLKVRFRIDGILHSRPVISKALQAAVTSRIKIMATIDISESRIPQDGRISFQKDGKAYDVRASTFPTIYGEKVVLRVLYKERVILGLEQLGFTPSALDIFRKSITRPNGIILVTGPTGSGKTTTLYSTLTSVNSTEKNIMTLEDPVEYEVPSIQQSQINPKAGLTFALGLRAMLRQDPDVILVGEMRDAETVDVAVRAALTGHLVFSTLHTNDAVGAIPRLMDMGVNVSLMASSFVAILAQRLVRKICPDCKETGTPDSSLLQLVGIDGGREENTFYRGKGCPRCFETGYRGRFAVFEILPVSPAIAQMITQRSSSQAILEKAREEGMTTMMDDGLEKAKLGITTLDEVIRLTHTV